jgi:hypothetical protein
VNNHFLQGHVDPWWKDEHVNLDYKYLPFKPSTQVDIWIKQGFSRLNLNGGLYDMSNPLPESSVHFFSLFDWKNVGVSYYRMVTCDFLPLHKDDFATYRKKFNLTNPSIIRRAIVFLEDWKSGHYFEIEKTAIMNWKAGDWVMWQFDAKHAAGNLGESPRYTVQITGILQ